MSRRREPSSKTAHGTGCCSHDSQLRLDGSEPVAYEIKLDDMALFGVGMELKYRP